jgi:hypothetical protein
MSSLLTRETIKNAIKRCSRETNRFCDGKTSINILQWQWEPDGNVVITLNDEPPSNFMSTLSMLAFVNGGVEKWIGDESERVHNHWNVRIPITSRRGDMSKLVERATDTLTSGEISWVFIVEVCLLAAAIVYMLYFTGSMIYDLIF